MMCVTSRSAPSTIGPRTLQEADPLGKAPLFELTLNEWQAFAHSHPGRAIFDHRNAISLPIDSYGFCLHIPSGIEDRRIMGHPTVGNKQHLGSSKLISLPFTDCISMLSQTDDAVEKLQERLRSDPDHRYRTGLPRTEHASRPDQMPRGQRTLGRSRPYDEIMPDLARALRTILHRGVIAQFSFPTTHKQMNKLDPNSF